MELVGCLPVPSASRTAVALCGAWRCFFFFFVRSAPPAVYFQVKYSKSKFKRTNRQLFLFVAGPYIAVQLGVN